MRLNTNLAAAVYACTLCPLGKVRDEGECMSTPADPGSRYTEGGLMVLAESPGFNEERVGRPLVGRAGQLMDRLLAGAGLSRADIVVANIVRCRPPDNRLDRHPEAVVACNQWTIREIEAYNPGVVLLCGNHAMRRVFGATSKITAMRGRPRFTGPDFEYGSRGWLSTWHPAYALRNPEVQPTIVSDLALALSLCRA